MQTERIDQRNIQQYSEDGANADAQTADDEILHHEVAHDRKARRTQRAPNANLARTPADVETREADNSEAGDDHQEDDNKAKHLYQRRLVQVGEFSNLVHRLHAANDTAFVTGGQHLLDLRHQ